MEILKDIQVNISREEVLRLQGWRGKRSSRNVENALTSQIEEGFRLVQPKAMYTMIGVVQLQDDCIKLDNGLVLKIPNATQVWGGSQWLVVAICTIGPTLEHRVSELFDAGEYPMALMLDSVGSVAVESVADYVNAHLCQLANNMDTATGPRLSPGYGRWELADQQVIFSILPGEEIGVLLNEDSVMLPQKSTSFCMGIGRDLVTIPVGNRCEHCRIEDCAYRRRP